DRDDERTLMAAFEVIMAAIASRIANPFHLPVIVPTASNRQLVKAVADVSRVFDSFVSRHGVRGTGDLIDLLVQRAKLADPEWRYNVTSVFIAGYETTAVALTWIWQLLSHHPDVTRKVHAEIDAVLGDRTAGEDDLPALIYTEAVMKEAMRLY